MGAYRRESVGVGCLAPTIFEEMERETGFEPATSTLARSHSTTELFPLAGRSRDCTKGPRLETTVAPSCLDRPVSVWYDAVLYTRGTRI